MGYGTKTLVILFLFASSAHAFRGGGITGSIKSWCESRVDRMHLVRYETDALQCADFYFLNQQFEHEERPFTYVLGFIHRASELNPKNYNTQTNIIWLNYSHWVMFRETPHKFPHFEHSLQKAYIWANRMEKSFSRNPLALKSLADQLNTIATFYKPELNSRVVQLYTKAEYLSRNLTFKLRCRLNIAHKYRIIGETDKAIASYTWALELDRENKIAKHYLNELQVGLLWTQRDKN
jgi:tetratricopeptide (TPR) repeat protein